MALCTTFPRKDMCVTMIFSCLRGRLLEVNTRLLEEPSLLNEKVIIKRLCYRLASYRRLHCAVHSESDGCDEHPEVVAHRD